MMMMMIIITREIKAISGQMFVSSKLTIKLLTEI